MKIRIECAPRLTISTLRGGSEIGQQVFFGMAVCQILQMTEAKYNPTPVPGPCLPPLPAIWPSPPRGQL